MSGVMSGQLPAFLGDMSALGTLWAALAFLAVWWPFVLAGVALIVLKPLWWPWYRSLPWSVQALIPWLVICAAIFYGTLTWATNRCDERYRRLEAQRREEIAAKDKEIAAATEREDLANQKAAGAETERDAAANKALAERRAKDKAAAACSLTQEQIDQLEKED